MKYLYAALLAFLVAGCTKKTTIQFTGTTPGITEGEFTIKDSRTDSVVVKAPIKDGTFTVTQDWDAQGYYYLLVAKKDMGTNAFDVFLEPGTYNITTDPGKPYIYPDIKSSSKNQTQLTEYYHLSDTINDELHKKAKALSEQLTHPTAKQLPPALFNKMAAELNILQQKEARSGSNALAAFVNKYPDSEIGFHILVNIDYPSDPEAYYAIYQKLAPQFRNSPRGKQIGDYLAMYANKPAKPDLKN